ncbi:TetR/AcrR family transcriptional regulator [Bacillus sp. ISL-75]|jgi:AcrR family transcriptional regulator|uniref:TetR/AcrR family transcriptional regulator n=1 Tax=Priestia megaterium TaxID=1404 RepID=A0A6H1P437_PRIMG|nr:MULTISPECIES: TetR/AcrR family transcriptional regulator [Bacillaceae]MBT2729519.1 TetR/AcrR family transcriptional regulator [Bacillus sp. ISL-75]QIZ08313.1 TetR/AcrR family transcriptional regulator [Priestia megaterium]
MTSDQIKEVSLKHFAKNGYEGASLAHIAEDVGIKKQSIYTHFKGKDELFLQLCRDASENEIRFVINFIEINKTRPIKEFLYDFLLQSIDRYGKNDSSKFWIRTAFFPPNHLKEMVMKNAYEYLDKLEELLIPIIKKAIAEGEISSIIDEKRATAAYLGILDAIFVEMLYGGPERLLKRFEASWYVYWHGLSKEL